MTPFILPHSFEDVSLLASLQVITSIGELVEMCSPQILSGWRPLFSALRTVHGSKTDTKDYLVGEYSMGTSDTLYRTDSHTHFIFKSYSSESCLLLNSTQKKNIWQ